MGRVKDKMLILKCSGCGRKNYFSRKNHKKFKQVTGEKGKTNLNKHCKFCKKHTLHKQVKS